MPNPWLFIPEKAETAGVFWNVFPASAIPNFATAVTLITVDFVRMT